MSYRLKIIPQHQFFSSSARQLRSLEPERRLHLLSHRPPQLWLTLCRSPHRAGGSPQPEVKQNI